MNHIYRLVWNACHAHWQAAPETARGHARSSRLAIPRPAADTGFHLTGIAAAAIALCCVPGAWASCQDIPGVSITTGSADCGNASASSYTNIGTVFSIGTGGKLNAQGVTAITNTASGPAVDVAGGRLDLGEVLISSQAANASILNIDAGQVHSTGKVTIRDSGWSGVEAIRGSQADFAALDVETEQNALVVDASTVTVQGAVRLVATTGAGLYLSHTTDTPSEINLLGGGGNTRAKSRD